MRAFPGGLDGFEMKEAKGTQKVLVNLGELKKSLSDYLAEADKKRPFLDDDRPMELKHLRLVALDPGRRRQGNPPGRPDRRARREVSAPPPRPCTQGRGVGGEGFF